MLKSKKEWSKPQIFDLSVIQTKGGIKYEPQADGPAVYENGKWWTPSGKS